MADSTCVRDGEKLRLAVRGSEGIYVVSDDGGDKEVISSSNSCRVLEFSTDGSLVAWCDGSSVTVKEANTKDILFTLQLPKTRHLRFSPKSTYLATWEPYVTSKDLLPGWSNLCIWNMRGERLAEFTQKRQEDWCPQWSDDELLCCRNVTNEVHCFGKGVPSRDIDRKLQVTGLAKYSLSPGPPPYKIAVYVPGSKGAPSFVRLYTYPSVGVVVASKSFYKADSVDLVWNAKGTALLVVTAVDVDKSGASYYGEQGLHYLSAKGDGNTVPLKKKGPIYAVKWSPNSEDFCVCYGFMPGNVTLFNRSSESIYEFGSGHRNIVYFNLQGNILTLAGFGNLRGNMEFWNRKELKSFSSFQASDATGFEWSPDGVHFVTSTTAPRLREGNGFKIWHVARGMLHSVEIPKPHELWEVKWQPHSAPLPVTDLATLKSTAPSKSPQQPKPTAYVPPALRGRPAPTKFKLHEFEPPETVEDEKSKEPLSKAALKNKRKKEAKLRSKQEPSVADEKQDAVAIVAKITAAATTVPSSTGTSSDKEKALKSLRKKLNQIEALKEKQQEGIMLEANQIEKLKTEQSIRDSIEALDLNI